MKNMQTNIIRAQIGLLLLLSGCTTVPTRKVNPGAKLWCQTHVAETCDQYYEWRDH